MTRTVALSDDVIAVLSRSTLDGATLRLPPERLAPSIYRAVDKALQAIGGKWNRKAAGHTFSDEAALADALAAMLGSGSVAPPSKNGYFPTPPALVARLLELADVQPQHRVLEPSAGQGAIADALRDIVQPQHLHLVELRPENVAELFAKHYVMVDQVDFLAMRTEPYYDRVVMNPPFERQQDIDHVRHAWDFLRSGGRLVSVMASSVTFRQDAKARSFRDFLDRQGAYVETNPSGSFRESGTNVSTITIAIDRHPEATP